MMYAIHILNIFIHYFNPPILCATITSSTTNTANNLHSGLLLLVEEEEVEEDVGAVDATDCCLLVVAEGNERLPHSINDSSFVICSLQLMWHDLVVK